MAKTERVLRAALNATWVIDPPKLDEILGFLEAHAAGEHLTADEVKQHFAAAGHREPQRVGGVAVLPLFGTITHRASMMSEYSGGTSTKAFQAAFDAAIANEEVSAIVIDCDSPGGVSTGVEETFRRIYAARGKKPIYAVANGMMASAAYWICCAADEIAVTPSGMVGSIGVFAVHTDVSEAAKQAGIKHTVIRAGRYKADTLSLEPLSDEAREAAQAEINECYDMFVAAVAKGRKVRESAVRTGFGEGRAVSAKRAVREGLADRVATLEEVLADLGVGRRASGGRRRAEGSELEFAAAAEDLLLHGTSSHGDPAGLLLSAASSEDGAVYQILYPSATESQTCPDCGAEMQREEDDWICPECVGKDPQGAGGAVLPGDDSPPAVEPAPQGQEKAMSQQGTAVAGNGAATQQVDVMVAIEAERKRAADVRNLALSHGLDAARANALADEGLSIEQASVRILNEIRQQSAATPGIRVGADRETQQPFRSLGEQLRAIAAADGGQGGTVDKRLHGVMERYATATGSNISTPEAGGWLLQQDFTQGIATKMWDEGRVLSRVNKTPIGEGFNGLTRNVLKEASRTTGNRYGGVRVYRADEAATVEASKPSLRRQEIKLEKLMGIWYATEETIRDAVALTVEGERAFRRELTFVAENEIFRGTGAGQCLGFLSSPALVSVVPESGQAAGTVVAMNVAKMAARMAPSSFANSLWYINSSVIPYLITMRIGDQPVFLPGGSLAGAPFGTILGRPVEPAEYCSGIGSLGDIVLADLGQYTAIDKGGETWQSSIHVRFLYDETAFKLTYRFNGQPDWETAVTPFQGNDTISPFVALASR